MAIVILKHKVENFKKWKPYYDNDRERRQKAGLKEIICGQDSEEPNMVYMIFESNDPSQVRKMIHDPELKEVMDEAGVIERPELIIIEE